MGELPTIVHLDADAFFVSVEQAANPSLYGKKCAVGGRERGIIASASYEARAVGIYTPMPTAQALRICPDLILIAHGMGKYGEVSRKMFDLCETLTPYVQRNSIDEGYLDLRPCGLRDQTAVEKLVHELQQRIWRELAVPVSMGLATNKLVAQIASKLRKPRGFVVVPAGDEASFLAPLKIGKLPGIGAKTEARLNDAGIFTVTDLLAASSLLLEEVLGDSWSSVVRFARGEDDSPVETEEEDAKSYSQQETFSKDISERAEIERITKGMLDELMAKVRRDQKRVRTLTVKVRYPDFTQDTQGHSLGEATDLEGLFYPVLTNVLRGAWKRRSPLRLVSVRLSGVEARAEQLDLFAQDNEKRRRLADAMDRLNQNKKSAGVLHAHQLPGKSGPHK